MMSTLGALFLLLFVHGSLALRLTDKLAKDAGEILEEAKTDRTIRQCECNEQHKCFDESKDQLFDCVEDCWHITKQITNDTAGLRQCLKSRVPILENFFGKTEFLQILHLCLDCLETNLDSCSTSKTADNITYIDYHKVINNAEQRIKKQTLKLVKSVGSNIQKLIKTVLELGSCVKSCFMKKNTDGFCFDHVGCQPKIEVKPAVKALKVSCHFVCENLVRFSCFFIKLAKYYIKDCSQNILRKTFLKFSRN